MNLSFQHKNEGFLCENCKAEVPAASRTCRDHCTECLYSKHVDNFPGDRACECQGLMKPKEILLERGEMRDIVFVCTKCHKAQNNKIASDDNREALLTLWKKQSGTP